MKTEGRWPKKPVELTAIQKQQRQEFLKLWHEVLPRKYGIVEKFNHENAILKWKYPSSTLEIGGGLGEHLYHEDLDIQDYTVLEVRPDFAEIIKGRFPNVKVIQDDIEKPKNLRSMEFDRVVAIHVLEHLRNLPVALQEIKRILKPGGVFHVVIPCEGGIAYELARVISAKRLFEKTYKTSYTPIIKNEHVNTAWEVLEEIQKIFRIKRKIFWPLKIPVVTTNLGIALECYQK